MSDSFRRFEVLLPRRFNDGNLIPDDLLADTLLQLEQRFGAVSCETQSIRGLWRQDDQLYRDELVRVFVDVPDVAENRAFFLQLKEQVKAQFQQLDIWMTTYPIEVL